MSKIPGIGDVPILGQLFRSKNITHSVVELMVVVTPTVVDPLNDTASPIMPKLPVPMLDPSQFDKKTGELKPARQPSAGTGGNQ
jgi:pilus assembly protein CpaC